MSATTSSASLKGKYSNFAAPTARIKIDGTEILEKKSSALRDVIVDITAGYEASGCKFSILGEYDFEQSAFKKTGAISKIQLGAKLSIELGYIQTEEVFTGLITQIDYVFTSENAPVIEVEGMDAKCLLMKTQRLEIRSEKKMSNTVETLLSAQPFSQYIGKKDVSAFGDSDMVIPTALESDYNFLVEQAKYYGCEFFIVQGDVYFRSRPKSASTVMTLDVQDGLIISARFSVRGEGLVKKVTVKGIDNSNGNKVSGSSTISGTFSSGNTASRMIGSTEKVVFDPLVSSADEASSRAKVLANELKSSFGILECKCVGIPEIGPGRQVSFTGLSTEADVTGYIRRVRHTFDSLGFYTSLEVEVDSL